MCQCSVCVELPYHVLDVYPVDWIVLLVWFSSTRVIDSTGVVISLLCSVGQAGPDSAQSLEQVARKSQQQPGNSLLVVLCADSKQNDAHHDHWITAESLHHCFVVLLLYI